MQPHELLLILWIATELVIRFRRRVAGPAPSDRGSLRILWITMTIGCALAVTTSYVEGWRLPWDARTGYVTGSVLMALGLAVRWWAVLVLGRYFTVDVRIQSGHELVTRGPYRWMRHPSYTGLALVLVGLCGVLGSTLSALCLLGLTLPPLAWRIVIEERALAQEFGPRWTEYARCTKRLVPFVF